MSAHMPVGPEQNGTPRLSPPGADRDSRSSRVHSYTPLLILIAFILLLAGAAAVILIFPDVHTEKPPTTTVAQPENTPPPAVHDQSVASEAERDEATAILEKLLSLQVQAEADNISTWADSEYQKVLDSTGQADRLFADQNYLQATEIYQEAITDLTRLLDAKSDIYQTALQQGMHALDNKNSREAAEHLAKALAIDPTSNEALKGAQQANTLDAVLALHQEALILEQGGKIEAAEEKLTKLLEIDPEYRAAKASLASIRKALNEQRFQAVMTTFFSSLETGEFAQARSSLEMLKRLNKEHPQVSQAETLLAEKEESARLDGLRSTAERQAADEQWQAALATYQKALMIAPEALFAVNGRDLATKRLKLDTAIRKTITRPERLQDDVQLEAAKKLAAFAQQVNPAGPRLASQISKLQKLINLAATPVNVIIESDNRTDITIFHVGRIGHFFSKLIVLKPGKYTIVGIRAGYRDTRTIVEVTPEKETNHFFIQCREPI